VFSNGLNLKANVGIVLKFSRSIIIIISNNNNNNNNNKPLGHVASTNIDSKYLGRPSLMSVLVHGRFRIVNGSLKAKIKL